MNAPTVERLPPCPSSPNCVCSQDPSAARRVEPLPFQGDEEDTKRLLRAALSSLPRTRILREDGRWLHAVSTSLVFRFVDDLELLLDPAAGLVHVRSASRLGRSDFGVNRRRVEALRRAYLALAC